MFLKLTDIHNGVSLINMDNIISIYPSYSKTCTVLSYNESDSNFVKETLEEIQNLMDNHYTIYK